MLNKSYDYPIDYIYFVDHSILKQMNFALLLILLFDLVIPLFAEIEIDINLSLASFLFLIFEFSHDPI